jgi:helix-turn-helix protein
MENDDSSGEEERMSQENQAVEVEGSAAGESVRAVAEELGIRRKRLYVWKDRYAEFGCTGIFSLHWNVRSYRHHQTCVLLLLGPLSKAMTRGLWP